MSRRNYVSYYIGTPFCCKRWTRLKREKISSNIHTKLHCLYLPPGYGRLVGWLMVQISLKLSLRQSFYVAARGSPSHFTCAAGSLKSEASRSSSCPSSLGNMLLFSCLSPSPPSPVPPHQLSPPSHTARRHRIDSVPPLCPDLAAYLPGRGHGHPRDPTPRPNPSTFFPFHISLLNSPFIITFSISLYGCMQEQCHISEIYFALAWISDYCTAEMIDCSTNSLLLSSTQSNRVFCMFDCSIHSLLL